MDRQAWIDQEHARNADTIRRCGWAIQYIGGDTCSRPGCECPPSEEPPFAYTIGLFGLGHPELLIIGVDPTTALGVLNTLGQQIQDGQTLMPGIIISFDEWPHRIIPETVPNAGDIVLRANSYYQHPPEHSIPVLQLTYDDSEGRFPWDDGYANPELQPRPGMFSA